MRLHWIGLLACLLACAGAIRAQDPPKPKLNVLFILSDDLRPELASYGHPVVKTPNIDGLARAGVRFERAYCQYPLCNPSRTSLLTGRHPTTTGVLDNRIDFRADHPDWITLPQFFKQNGYASLRTGKIFHGGIDDPLAWTEGGDPPRARTTAATKKAQLKTQDPAKSDRRVVLEGDGEQHADFRAAETAIDYLGRHQDRPFFLACGFTKPHSPPTAPKRFYEMYDPKQVVLPPDFAARPTVPEGFPKLSVPPRSSDLFIGRDASPEEAREMIRAYWASLTWVDWNVGRVLAELDRLKLRDKTVIVFWGDHGYHLGEKGKWSKHGSLFEVGARVPLIIVAPGAKGNGKSSPRIVQTLDLYPTLVELCGLTPPSGLQGQSLALLLRQPDAPWNHPAFTVAGSLQNLHKAVRTDRFRYAEYQNGQGGAMLFDELNDPQERVNLADNPQFAEVRARLSRQLRELK